MTKQPSTQQTIVVESKVPGAKKEPYDPSKVATFHCISRCVRRAFLCGFDKLSNRSFEHRREWINNRLGLLSEVFAVEIISYTVMSDHLHTVIRTRPDLACAWSDSEVERRWRILYPLSRLRAKREPTEKEIAQNLAKPEQIAIYRQRLANFSWFNRCICEWVARRANKEDDCKGRFWEGRFKSQRLEEVGALVTCCSSVDLNPLRAFKHQDQIEGKMLTLGF